MTAAAFLVRRLGRAVLAAMAVTLAAAGCGGSPAAPGTSSGAGLLTISAKSLPRVGTVLVNAAGDVLYMFVPDDQRQVTCVSWGQVPTATRPTWPRRVADLPGVHGAGPG